MGRIKSTDTFEKEKYLCATVSQIENDLSENDLCSGCPFPMGNFYHVFESTSYFV